MKRTEDENRCCEIHKDAVLKLEKNFPSDEITARLSDFFKLFGGDTRIKILYSLLNGELCVCDIAVALKTSVSAVSHQLKLLRDANLVKTRLGGKSIFYSLADEHVIKIIKFGCEHIAEKNTR